MTPLYKVASTQQKLLDWTSQLRNALAQTQQALAQATLLHHPMKNAPTALTVDASDKAVGGVLEQFAKAQWRRLAFFSRQLRKPETKNSAFDRELLAIHLAIRHFRYFLEGRRFAVFTDHKPLIFAFSKLSDPWSSRQQRQLAAISEFTTDIRHITGKKNCVADALSRASVSSTQAELGNLDYIAMAADQQHPDIQAYRTAISNLRLEDIPIGNSQTKLLCDVSTGTPRLMVPPSWRSTVFHAIHNLSQPSIRTTRKLVASKFVWHGLNKQIGLWTKQCIASQKSKIQRHVKSPIAPYPLTNARFQHINIDIVGPLSSSQGHRYLLTVHGGPLYPLA